MKNFTITVGIPAYNEQQNIEYLLLSLFKQKQLSFDLAEIVVYLDASTDNTEKIVEKISNKFPIVKLIKGNSQKGKYYRVNQILNMTRADGVIVLDADIVLVGDEFLENLVKVLIQDSKGMLTNDYRDNICSRKFSKK